MVRRSVLVYDLLRTEQPPDGFSQKEILTHISNRYNIAANKTLQRDVAAALRRGLDFGILAKKGNKFRFNPNLQQTMSLKRNRRNTRTEKTTRRKKRKSDTKPATGRTTATERRRKRERQRPATRGKTRKQSTSVPRPRLPKPPSLSPKRRYLAEEPIPKIIKHS